VVSIAKPHACIQWPPQMVSVLIDDASNRAKNRWRHVGWNTPPFNRRNCETEITSIGFPSALFNAVWILAGVFRIQFRG
ncbi:MAG: hypothetical protein PVG51_17575, partial [Desulfosarcina sp.]